MDWLDDFKNLVENSINKEELGKLKEKKFYGFVQINFFMGKPVNFNKYLTSEKLKESTLIKGG